jgi:predicted N-acyltransferase
LHWIADAGFARAVGEYLDAERKAVDEEIEILTSYGPIKRGNENDDEIDGA